MASAMVTLSSRTADTMVVIGMSMPRAAASPAAFALVGADTQNAQDKERGI